MGFFTVMYLESIGAPYLLNVLRLAIYMFFYSIRKAASVLITLRYTSHQLQKDYLKVHDSPFLTLLVLILAWVSVAIGAHSSLITSVN